MKKILIPLILLALVLSISKITYDGWFWGINRLEGLSSIWKPPLPLQTIRINQKAYKSYELPIKSEAAVVLDANKGEILFEKNMEKKLPIASLTKLMTSLVFLETNPNLNDTATITPADAEGAGWSQLKIKETFTLCDLLHASLMSSNNRVTRTLARSCGLTSDEFIDRMNQKANKIGLINTVFFEPTGLDTNNRSTALDCARLLYFAQKESLIGSIMGKTTYQFNSLGKRRRIHQIRNTNKLLFTSWTPGSAGNVRCGKTGYNGASGFCLSTLVEGRDGEEIIAVVLGAPSSGTRFKEIKSIVEWATREEKSEISPQLDDGS
jgi:serine-type D-Ala-D-Ala endopeptidase (penicillin-binding protein 7)